MEINSINTSRLIPKDEELVEIKLSPTRDYNSTGSSDRSLCSMCIDDFDTNPNFYECTVCKNKMHKECLIHYIKYHKIKEKKLQCFICNKGMFLFYDLEDITIPDVPPINPEYIPIETNRNHIEEYNEDLNYFVTRRISIKLKYFLNSFCTLIFIISLLSCIVALSKILS